MRYKVKIHEPGIVRTISAEEGANLLKLLREQGVSVNTPCGGSGTCGKCAVKVTGHMAEPSGSEVRLLGEQKLGMGFRLACSNYIFSDIDVYITDSEGEASIVTGGRIRDIEREPVVRKQYVELTPPSLDDQTPCLERALAALDGGHTHDRAFEGGLAVLKDISGILKDSDYKVTLVSIGGRLAAAEKGDTSARLCGMAFDIGTTTIAAYLYDLNTGRRLAVGSKLNPQRRYGADVISRINYTMMSEENRLEMHNTIRGCIDGLAGEIAMKAETALCDIYAAVFTGNTTMQHFLMDLDASGLAVSPFIPVTTELQYFMASELGLGINEHAIAAVFPGVSAYVGGDTVAAILSSGIYEADELTLLVDIGTNGEIVLGNREWLIACSTAAGPAFEGANIRNGVGGITGAIDCIGPGPDFNFTTIGGAKPVGICGSGIIDAAARLLDAGLIDETGRLADGDELELPERERLSQRLIELDGTRSFIVVSDDAGGSGGEIAITQRDIREIQNAKAAIAAGIDTLLKHSGKSCADVAKVFLAGGFGSSIHIDSAMRIGLLPKAFQNRVEAIGNASGAGAAEGLLSEKMLKLAASIRRGVKYIELSASAYFTQRYVDNMLF